jgi:uncharacterized protein (TIGR00251 family)
MAFAPQPAWLRIGADSVTLEVLARPGSSRHAVIGAGPRGLIVALHAPPAEGRANAELVEVLADALAIPRASIAIERGGHGRNKLLRIASVNPAALAAKISGLAQKA